ncbi:MAG: hypothetical protein WC873_02300, partial [Candidatus Gracilibacteria bacterium]
MRNFILGLFTGLIVVILGIFGYMQYKTWSQAPKIEEDTPVSSTIFDVTKVKVGDKIGDWTIITIEAPDNKYAGWTPKNDEVSVEFVGNVAVSGKFKWDSKITRIKFYPDSESQNKLPKIVSDNNSPYLVTTSDSELINGDQGDDIEMSLTG